MYYETEREGYEITQEGYEFERTKPGFFKEEEESEACMGSKGEPGKE